MKIRVLTPKKDILSEQLDGFIEEIFESDEIYDYEDSIHIYETNSDLKIPKEDILYISELTIIKKPKEEQP